MYIPDKMKYAEVAPGYKKKNNLNKKNYRPISILTSSSKLLECVLNDQMLHFIEDKLSEYIAAYRQGFSCEQVLVKACDSWNLALDRGEHVGCVLMDLSKAFDSIPLGLLLAN